MSEAKERATAAINRYGLFVESVFVPWNESRSYKEGAKTLDRNFNWKVTLKQQTDKGSRSILTTDFSSGIACSPSYDPGMSLRGLSVDDAEAIKRETITGETKYRKKIEPDPVDVIWCIVSSSDAIDYDGFEDWASSLGYDADSRSAEKTYRACIKTALTLRSRLGEDVLRELREAFQDY